MPTLAKDLLAASPKLVGQARTTRLVLVIGDDWRGLKALNPGDSDALKGFDATHDTCAG